VPAPTSYRLELVMAIESLLAPILVSFLFFKVVQMLLGAMFGSFFQFLARPKVFFALVLVFAFFGNVLVPALPGLFYGALVGIFRVIYAAYQSVVPSVTAGL
jgi:hypothetical protein